MNNTDAINILEKVKKRDAIKEEFAKTNGIPLLHIRYDDISLISNIIKNFLNLNI